MTQAFRESLDPAAVRVKSLEARLAQEAHRCLQLEKQVEALCERADQAVARIHGLEAKLAAGAERMLELEKQMQAFLGSAKHPIAQVRDREPRIPERKTPPARVIPRVAGRSAGQARRRV